MPQSLILTGPLASNYMSILVLCSEREPFSVLGTGGVTGTYGNFGGGGDQIAEAGNEIIESFNNPIGSATKFATLREAFFDSRRDFLFRYAIFGHQTNCASGHE